MEIKLSVLVFNLVWFDKVNVSKPFVGTEKAKLVLLYPGECRERGISYRSRLQAMLYWRVNGGAINSEVKNLGLLPILVGVCFSNFRATNVICKINLLKILSNMVKIQKSLVVILSSMESSE